MHAPSSQKEEKPTLWHGSICAEGRAFKLLYMQHRNTGKGITNTAFFHECKICIPQAHKETKPKFILVECTCQTKSCDTKAPLTSAGLKDSDDPPPIPEEKQWSAFLGGQQAVASERKKAFSSFPQKNLNTVLTSWRRTMFFRISCSPNYPTA